MTRSQSVSGSAPLLISGTTLWNYAFCRRRPYLDWFASARDRGWSSAAEVTFATGVDAERQVLQGRKAQASAAGAAIVAADERLPSRSETVAAMRKGVAEIHQGLLVHGHYVARPDVLVRRPGASKLGRFHYVPIELKSGMRYREGAHLQVGFYGVLLELIQSRLPDEVLLQTYAASEAIPMAALAPRVEVALASLSRMHSERSDPGPHLTSECAKCPWHRGCQRDAHARGHISIVNGMSKPLAIRLDSIGVTSVQSLATARPEDLLGPQIPTYMRARNLIASAKAVVTGRTTVHAPEDVPRVAPVELFLDVETDGAPLPVAASVFLWGLLVSTGGRRARFHSLFAATPSARRKAARSIVKLLQGYPDAPIFHYGSLERSIARDLSALPGAGDLPSRMTDVLGVVRRAVALPHKGLSLKAVATAFGFRFRTELSGQAVPSLFAQWRRTRAASIRKKLERYNEDDVRALDYLLKSLRRA